MLNWILIKIRCLKNFFLCARPILILKSIFSIICFLIILLNYILSIYYSNNILYILDIISKILLLILFIYKSRLKPLLILMDFKLFIFKFLLAIVFYIGFITQLIKFCIFKYISFLRYLFLIGMLRLSFILRVLPIQLLKLIFILLIINYILFY